MAIAGRLAEARRGERQSYRAALAARESVATAARPAPPRGAAADSKTLCLRGAETVAARVARFLDSRPVDAAGRLDLGALARLSRRAAELDRRAEVPQRMGRQRSDAGDGWDPIDPPDRICVEMEEGEAHGSRRAGGAK